MGIWGLISWGVPRGIGGGVLSFPWLNDSFWFSKVFPWWTKNHHTNIDPFFSSIFLEVGSRDSLVDLEIQLDHRPINSLWVFVLRTFSLYWSAVASQWTAPRWKVTFFRSFNGGIFCETFVRAYGILLTFVFFSKSTPSPVEISYFGIPFLFGKRRVFKNIFPAVFLSGSFFEASTVYQTFSGGFNETVEGKELWETQFPGEIYRDLYLRSFLKILWGRKKKRGRATIQLLQSNRSDR